MGQAVPKSMSNRPYTNLKYYELEDIAEANRDNWDVYQEVLHELSFRTSRAAIALRDRLLADVEIEEPPALPFLYELIEAKGLLTRDDTVETFPFITGHLLNGYMVGATGDDPVTEMEIRSLAFWQGAILGDDDIWQDNQIIVVGRNQFDKTYLKQAIDLILREKIHIHFIAQELFLDFAQDGIFESHYPGDTRIAEHPGLTFLSSIGFKWPVVGKYRGNNKLAKFEGEDHVLAIKYGYSVRKRESITSRRRALTLGISALGLQTVAYHIASLIKLNSGNPIMKDAVPRWREDLEWLYQTKYLTSIHSFIWPSLY